MAFAAHSRRTKIVVLVTSDHGLTEAVLLLSSFGHQLILVAPPSFSGELVTAVGSARTLKIIDIRAVFDSMPLEGARKDEAPDPMKDKMLTAVTKQYLLEVSSVLVTRTKTIMSKLPQMSDRRSVYAPH